MTAIATHPGATFRVPAGRNLDADLAEPDDQIRDLHTRIARETGDADTTATALEQAALDADDEDAVDRANQARAEADRLAELRDYLRAILLQHRRDNDPDYRRADLRRRERILADPDLDPRLRDLYLDETILDIRQLAQLFGGITELQVYNLIYPTSPDRERPRPHPRVAPEPAVILHAGSTAHRRRPQPGLQLGEAAEWWRVTNRGLWHADIGDLLKNPVAARHGRPPNPTPRQRERGRPRKAD